MPNGRGQIDCGYCLHWSITEDAWGYGSGAYDGRCNCWDVAIPRDLTREHRFCLDFLPSKYFGEDNAVGHPEEIRTTEEIAQDRLAEVMQANPEMEIGILYHAPASNMKDVQELMRLDQPHDDSSKGVASR